MKPIFQIYLQFRDIWPRFAKKLPKLRFLAIVLTLHHWFSLILHIMIDRWAWFLVVFVQFAGPVNVFLFSVLQKQVQLQYHIQQIGIGCWTKISIDARRYGWNYNFLESDHKSPLQWLQIKSSSGKVKSLKPTFSYLVFFSWFLSFFVSYC